MGTGGGGPIIIGDQDIVTVVETHIDKVAQFRHPEALRIIALYKVNENAITRGEQLFLLRCCADILDNA